MTQETTFTTVVTTAQRGAKLRRVLMTMPHVAPPGAEWTADHGGRHFEMCSFEGGPVELYMLYPNLGLYMHEGTVRRYAPGEGLRQAFRTAWYAAQPSKAARDAFEASAADEAR